VTGLVLLVVIFWIGCWVRGLGFGRFSAGRIQNVSCHKDVREFRLVRGDVRDFGLVRKVVGGVDAVFLALRRFLDDEKEAF